jgi:hypothetical protein
LKPNRHLLSVVKHGFTVVDHVTGLLLQKLGGQEDLAILLAHLQHQDLRRESDGERDEK